MDILFKSGGPKALPSPSNKHFPAEHCIESEGDRVTVEFELELATTVMKCFFYYKVCLLLLLMHVASVLAASSGWMQFCVVFGPRRPSTSKTWRGLRVATKEDQEWHKWPLCQAMFSEAMWLQGVSSF